MMQADSQLEFWEFLDSLVALCTVVIDRPRGSRHPSWDDLIYPLDYGYLEGTRSADGSPVDVWVGSLTPAGVDAVIISVDLFKRDAEYSILLGCSPADQQTILDFSNSGLMRVYLLPRRPDKNALFRGRRSVRRFRDDPVPQDVLRQVLEAATLAPSAHNSQPWRFAVLASREVKERLAQAMGADFLRDLASDGVDLEEARRQVERSRERILGAPVAVVLCLDRSVEDLYPEQRRQDASHLMMTQSVALAGGTMLLAAHAHDLGGVWMCAPLFAPAAVRHALDLPEEWEAQALILLGYPEQIPERRKRLSVNDVTRYYG
jgi:coenzyme F420-0:L-glutamate ligase/coenzyme F420-1:gamma-L-glutamate ligase